MTTTNHDQGATLVLGGTGKTGRRVAERLRGRGRQVRIGSRSAIPPFDWADRSSWAPVLDGVSSVYLAYAPDAGFPGAAETIGAFAELAVACGARRVVLLTGRGEAGAELSEQALRESGADWTVVRSSFFAQNFSEDFMVEAVRAGVVAFPASDVVEPFVDVDDLADVATVALTQDGHVGQLYDVTGPRLLSFPTAVADIAEACGRELVYLPVSVGEFQAGMIEQGTPSEFAAQLAELFGELLDGHNAHLGDGVRRVLGREPSDFRAYARAAAATGVWDASTSPAHHHTTHSEPVGT